MSFNAKIGGLSYLEGSNGLATHVQSEKSRGLCHMGVPWNRSASKFLCGTVLWHSFFPA